MNWAGCMKLFAVVIVSLMLLGCAGGQPAAPAQAPATTPPVTTPPVTAPPAPVKEVFKPIKLVYLVKNTGGNDVTVTLWLEKEKDCNGRKTLAGIENLKMIGDKGEGAWAKVTVYTDTGESGVSVTTSRSDMAFDDLKPWAQDLNIYLTINEMFANGGKNFVTDAVWNSTEPTLLKNVESISSFANYSIFRTGKTFTDKALPCVEFKLAEKSSAGYGGTYNLCVAEMSKDVPLPFVVAVGYDVKAGEGGPAWSLQSFSNEASGEVFVPQCLEPVKCKYVAVPANSGECTDAGGSMEAIKDDKGCPLRYECWTRDKIVLNELKHRQRPGCADPSAEIVSAARACFDQQKDIDPESNSNGCMVSIRGCK